MKNRIPTFLLLSALALFSFSWKTAAPVQLTSYTKPTTDSLYTLTGVVTDDKGEAIIGANIQIKNTYTGTISDIDGKFTLETKNKCETLLISQIGHQKIEIKFCADQKEKRIVLPTDTRVVEEVVIIGHSTGKKSSPGRKVESAPKPAVLMDRSLVKDAFPVTTILHAIDDTEVRESAAKPTTPANGPVGSRLLTAGEVNDFQKWDLWSDVADYDLAEWTKTWQIAPKNRYTIQLLNKEGLALPNAQVELLDNRGNVLWTAMSDNTGKAELWAQLYDVQQANASELRVNYQGKKIPVSTPKNFQAGINKVQVPVSCNQTNKLDIAFVVDATGSMGDEIAYLKAELDDVVKRMQDTLTGVDFRFGSVFYRDSGEEYLVREQAFSSKATDVLSFINKQQAGGGGDYPEAVDDALEAALSMDWSAQADARLLFLLLDAPPHDDPTVKAKLEKSIRLAAAKGIRIIPVVCSGIDKSTEYLLRSVALATNGTYVFLTDHSGIGGRHLEPSTDTYEVELFNDLLLRLVVQFGRSEACSKPKSVAITPYQQDTALVLIPQDTLPNGLPKVAWRYYPNPTMGQVWVQLVESIGEVYLADMNGKLLEKHKAEGRSVLPIDISQYPAGSYTIRYSPDGKKWWSGPVVLLKS